MTVSTRRRASVALLLAAGLTLSACSGSTPEANEPPAEAQAQAQADDNRVETNKQEQINQRFNSLPGRPAGVVDIDGTSGSLTGVARKGYASGSGAEVTQKESGEDAAFQRLCGGEIDLVDSGRAISRAEWDACQAVGLDVVQFQIAADAIVLAIKSETDVGGDCLRTDQVRDMFRAGSPVTNWADPKIELESVSLETGGPDPDNNAFTFFGRYVLDTSDPGLTDFRSDYLEYPTDDLTRDWVVGSPRDERLFDDVAARTGKRDEVRTQLDFARQVLRDARDEETEARRQKDKGVQDGRSLPDQAEDRQRVIDADVAVDAAASAEDAMEVRYQRTKERFDEADQARLSYEGTRGNVAFFRFPYYRAHEDELRPFEITGPGGERNCIFPSQQTIVSGEYPLSRQLLVTTTTRSLQRNDVKDFLSYFLTEADRLAEDASLVALPDADQRTQLRWIAEDEAPRLVAPESEGEPAVRVPAAATVAQPAQ